MASPPTVAAVWLLPANPALPWNWSSPSQTCPIRSLRRSRPECARGDAFDISLMIKECLRPHYSPLLCLCMASRLETQCCHTRMWYTRQHMWRHICYSVLFSVRFCMHVNHGGLCDTRITTSVFVYVLLGGGGLRCARVVFSSLLVLFFEIRPSSCKSSDRS